MASSKAETLDSAKEIKNVCPICFESFKTPRQFVPAPSSIGEPEKWTELIPINTIIQTLCEKKDQFCDACRRADEEEIATDWCKSCSTDLRDKLVRHINDLLEAHLDDLAKKVKRIKEKLAQFDDTVTDRQLLMTQYTQILTDTEKTPPPILVQNYLKIKRQFKQVTGLCLYKSSEDLHWEASKQLLKILDTLGLEDVRVEVKSTPIGSIELTCADMKLVCELPESGGDIFGGCFFENGDIFLADFLSRHCLYYSNKHLVRKITLRGNARDVIACKHSGLLIATYDNSESHIDHYDVKKLQINQNMSKRKVAVYCLAKSSEFIYAAYFI
uniref:Uncharacterized protein LOC111115515 n=1 Tax=Crassostrea virginica TaxID=6565 RepID=A0A8B8C2T0_CRAVI|nr:uncharacterized protein LOC111115515 [Crassostrea virginica]